jgi:IS5 family transposase
MLRDRYESRDLLQLVPHMNLRLEPELQELDRLLDDAMRLTPVKAALIRRHRHTATRGRYSTPVEVLRRLLSVKRLYGWSSEETEGWVSDRLILRQFCRV